MQQLTIDKAQKMLSQTMKFDEISESKKTDMLYVAVKLSAKKRNEYIPTKKDVKNFKDKDKLLMQILKGGGWIDNEKNIKVNLWIHYHKMKNLDFSTQVKLFKKCKKYGLTFSLVCKEPVMDFTTQFFMWSKIKKEFDEVCMTLGVERYKWRTPEKFSPFVKKCLMEFYHLKKDLLKREKNLDKHFENADHLRQGVEEVFHYCEDMKNQEMWNSYFKNNKQ